MTSKLQAYEVIYLTILIWREDCKCQGKPLLFLMGGQLIPVNGSQAFYHENTPLTVLLAVTSTGPFPKSQLIKPFCQVESPGEIGSFLKNGKVMRSYSGFWQSRSRYNWSCASVWSLHKESTKR